MQNINDLKADLYASSMQQLRWQKDNSPETTVISC